MTRGDGWATHKYQGGIEILLVLSDTVGIVPGRLPLVRGVEVEASIMGFDGLEENPERILEAVSGERLAMQATYMSNASLQIDLQCWAPFFAVLYESPHTVGRSVG